MPKAPHRYLTEVDPVLAAVIRQVGACKLVNRRRSSRRASPFESLAESIAYQQLHGKAAATIWSRVLSVYGGKLGTPKVVAATPLGKLRKAGLSRNKALAIKDLARSTLKGIVPTTAEAQRLSDEEIIDRCVSVRGIGRWTVEMFLIFNLGRMDVLPVDDYGVRAGFASAYGKKKLPTPKRLREYGVRWAPYRSAAAWYLWRALEIKRNKLV